ncbi:D-alanyl-D-alanine carboxypeptidase/D-alanyl-D-alanine-endopeptidase [Streptomyces sp. NPDC005438]|uniref:D-alanyl-D-alanine carboxypeptidase/D-alanyl-D-alanine endopeptidase n=1 Tax=Streptomyces sp. NPDC005438 TaxID=3156880 RepID=UPI0033BDFCA9
MSKASDVPLWLRRALRSARRAGGRGGDWLRGRITPLFRRVSARVARWSRRRVRDWRALPPSRRQLWRLTTSSSVLGLLTALVLVLATGPWDAGQRTAERRWAARWGAGSGEKHTDPDVPMAPRVLAELGDRSGAGEGDDNAPPPDGDSVAEALRPALKALDDEGGAKRHTAAVVDVASGKRLYAKRPDTMLAPASTVKVATALAALSARGAQHRLATRVVSADEGRTLTLVGGGDPTVTDRQWDALARRAADRGAGKVRLRYDTSLYRGPERHPIGLNDNIAPVTPLMVNEGRQDDSEHGPAPRAEDPAKEAAEKFAERLEKHGAKVEGEPRDKPAPAKARTLATHHSAPLSELVERMLTHSDNDIAEALARQTALARGEKASFKGASKAARAQLSALQLPLEKARFADGSGLSRDDRLSAGLLTRLLARAADPRHPELRSVLTGLPVAGFTGTLGKRYDGQPGRGLVRAKTGTLTGVNTLAGVVVDDDGRLLTFAFMAEDTRDAQAAQSALDRSASALAGCGCREGGGSTD